MAPRSIASGTISFGLVSIPVKLYAATEASAGISFNLLHAKCGSRLKQQYVCPQDGEVVPRDAMVKGYEFQEGKYVTFSAEELKALEQASTQAIEIAEFVPAEKVDAVYFEKAYFLGPEKGGAKAYRLLAEALRRAGKAAVARYAARGKQYLVLIRPASGRLVMQQLYYADEVRRVEEIPVDEAELKEPEVQLALQLVEQTASEEFHPEKYQDGVRQRVLEAIERKVAGQEIALAPTEEPRAQVIDLMEALKASLAAAPRKPGPAPASSEPEAEATAADRKPPKRARREAPAAEAKGKGGR
ncbi:MAG TPA: Ku protein [Anaeromyxobacteraceae bacterium]|nr:Ku protein [Anaeromyxobacteraceae bacterium]